MRPDLVKEVAHLAWPVILQGVLTTVVFFTAVNYIKVIPYGMLGQFQAESLAVSVTLLPLALVGILLGAWLHNRVNDRLFFRICYVFLFFTGLKLVGDGLASF